MTTSGMEESILSWDGRRGGLRPGVRANSKMNTRQDPCRLEETADGIAVTVQKKGPHSPRTRVEVRLDYDDYYRAAEVERVATHLRSSFAS
jgi:hypothetical protein